MDQEDHPTQDESSVDDSDYSIEYGEDPSTKNEKLKAKTNIGSNNPVDHKEDTSSSVVYDSNADSKTSEIDLLDLSSETDMSSIFNHTQNDSESDSEDFDSDTIKLGDLTPPTLGHEGHTQNDSESDSEDFDSDAMELGDLTPPTSGHEGHKFIDIPNSTAQLPNPHKIASGQLKSFEISDTVLWTPPSGINTYGALPNQTQSIRRHSVPLTPYVSSMAQVPPEQKDNDNSQVFQESGADGDCGRCCPRDRVLSLCSKQYLFMHIHCTISEDCPHIPCYSRCQYRGRGSKNFCFGMFPKNSLYLCQFFTDSHKN
jgi:hypothetical protein